MRVVGRCQVCVPSERWMSSLSSRNMGCRKVNLLPHFTSISLSSSGFKGSPAVITPAEEGRASQQILVISAAWTLGYKEWT